MEYIRFLLLFLWNMVAFILCFSSVTTSYITVSNHKYTRSQRKISYLSSRRQQQKIDNDKMFLMYHHHHYIQNNIQISKQQHSFIQLLSTRQDLSDEDARTTAGTLHHDPMIESMASFLSMRMSKIIFQQAILNANEKKVQFVQQQNQNEDNVQLQSNNNQEILPSSSSTIIKNNDDIMNMKLFDEEPLMVFDDSSSDNNTLLEKKKEQTSVVENIQKRTDNPTIETQGIANGTVENAVKNTSSSSSTTTTTTNKIKENIESISAIPVAAATTSRRVVVDDGSDKDEIESVPSTTTTSSSISGTKQLDHDVVVVPPSLPVQVLDLTQNYVPIVPQVISLGWGRELPVVVKDLIPLRSSTTTTSPTSTTNQNTSSSSSSP